jgi:hypothetical protein
VNGKKVMLGAWQWVLDQLLTILGILVNMVKNLKMVKNDQK